MSSPGRSAGSLAPAPLHLAGSQHGARHSSDDGSPGHGSGTGSIGSGSRTGSFGTAPSSSGSSALQRLPRVPSPLSDPSRGQREQPRQQAARFYRGSTKRGGRSGGGAMSEAPSSFAWGPGGHGEMNLGMQAEKMSLLSKEVMRLSQNGPIYLTEYGELGGTSTASGNAQAMEMEDLFSAYNVSGGTVDIERFLLLAKSMAETVHSLNSKGVFLRVTATDNWMLSRPAPSSGSAGPSHAANRCGREVPYLRLSPFVMTAVDPMAFDVRPEDLVGVYSANIPPELVRGSPGAADPFATDVYTLCATLYHILTGHHCLSDFDNLHGEEGASHGKLLAGVHAALAVMPTPPSKYRANLPEELVKILMKGLEKQQIHRYMNSLSLAKDLDKLLVAIKRRRLHPEVATEGGPLMQVGSTDSLARLTFPDKLFGREGPEAQLAKIMASVTKGGSALLSVNGESGTGKTSLVVEAVRHTRKPTRGAKAGGILVSVKVHPTTDRSSSILGDFLDGLLRPVLLAQTEKANKWRNEIAPLIGDVALSTFRHYLDADICQAFGLSVDKAAHPHASSEPVNPLTWDAVEGAVTRVIGRIAKNFKPLVLFFDDAQWLDPDLRLVDSLANMVPDTPGLCVVCAYRPAPVEPDATLPAFFSSPLYTRLEQQARTITIGALSASAVRDMLGMVLGPALDEGASFTKKRRTELDDVADFIETTVGSNPLAVRQILLALRDADAHPLTFDWDDEGWDFDRQAASPEVIGLEKGSLAATALPRKVLDAMTTVERTLLVTAACVIADGPFSIGLLSAASSLDSATVQSTVISLVGRKILQPAIAFVDELGDGDDAAPAKLRFSHDSWIEASLSLCAPQDLAAMHHQLATRLHAAGSGHVNLVASNLRKAIQEGYLLSPAERAQDLSILHAAAHAQYRALNSVGAISSFETCWDLMGGPDAWARDHEAALKLQQALFEAYLMNGQLVDALAVADSMAAKSRDEIEAVRSSQLQISAAAVVDPPKGVQRLRAVMKRHLDVDLDQEAASDELQTRALFKRKGYLPDLADAVPSEVPAALQYLLAESIFISYSSGPTYGIATSLCAIDLARKHGPTTMVAFPIMAVALFCCEVMNFDSAREWRRQGSELIERTESPYQRLTSTFAKHASSHFFMDSWQDAALALTGESLRSQDLAFYETAAFALAHALSAGFWSEMRLRSLIDAGRNVLPACEKRVPQAYVFAAVPLQAALNLSVVAPDRDPTVLAGLSQEISSSLPMHNNQWIAILLALHAIFKRPLWPVWTKQRNAEINTGALTQNIVASFLGTVAVFEGIRDGADVLPSDHDFVAESLSRFDSFIAGADCKHELTAMQRIMRATELALEGSFGEVIAAYNEAIDAAAPHSLHLLEALACEAAATYILRVDPGNTRSALGYLLQAHAAYQTWGATVKCQAMVEEHSSLRKIVEAEDKPHSRIDAFPSTRLSSTIESYPSKTTNPSSGRSAAMISLSTESARRSSEQERESKEKTQSGSVTSALEVSDQARRETRSSLDVASLLAASYSWQTETDARAMVLNLVRVILQQSGARFAAIAILYKDRGLVIQVAGSADSLTGGLDVHITAPEAATLAPTTIIDYVARTGQVAGIKELEMCGGADPFLSANMPAAIFASPIRFAGIMKGVIYFDSPIPSAFSATDRTIIASLANQAILALDRTLTAQELEIKIAERTAELSRQNLELDEARKTAIEAKDAETRFLLRMSHELRTPSNSIIVLADLLQEAPLEGLHREYLAQIKNSSRDLLGILTDVLDFSRLSSGSISIHPAPFRIRDMIETSLAGVGESATVKGLELVYTNVASEDLDTNVVGDEFRCRQILLNLLSNAIKFTDAPGFVSVTTTTKPLGRPVPDAPQQIELTIAVKDSGIGISPEKQGKLFQSFSQVHSAKHVGGSGLGLAISRALAQQMGGDATVRSELNVGSTFEVKIVVDRDEARETARTLYKHFADRPDRRRVLLHAGPLTVRSTLRNVLIDFGAEVEEASTVKDLDRRLTRRQGDFVVVDPLSATEDDVDCLNALVRHSYVGLVAIGNAAQCKTQPDQLLDDPRTLVLTRPSKLKSLHEAFVALGSRPDLDMDSISAPASRAEMEPMSKTAIKTEGRMPGALPNLSTECPLSILIVDDNAVNRLVFKRVVERLGYVDVDFAVDGLGAVETCRRKKFDLCLMDEEMPHLNGSQAMRKIHDEHPQDAPAIAMVTASAMPGDKERFLDRGFEFYLSKPLMIPDLIEVIRTTHRRMIMPTKDGAPNGGPVVGEA